MNGLSSQQAQAQLQAFGPNLLQQAPPRAVLWQFLAHFRNPLVVVLLVASALSAATGDAGGALIIGCIVLMSVTLDFVQAHRASVAASELALQVAVMARVLRDGVVVDRDVAQLVPGDVVMLSAGDLIPADARLLQSNDFFVDQSKLSGEAFPVKKRRPRCARPGQHRQRSRLGAWTPPTSCFWAARLSVARQRPWWVAPATPPVWGRLRST